MFNSNYCLQGIALINGTQLITSLGCEGTIKLSKFSNLLEFTVF